MKSQKYSRKLIVVLMTVRLIFTAFQQVFAAESFNPKSSGIAVGFSADASALPAAVSVLSYMKGHWAEEAVLDWLQSGRIRGYPDDTFKPDRPITRGEFVVLANRTFALEEKAPVHDHGRSNLMKASREGEERPLCLKFRI